MNMNVDQQSKTNFSRQDLRVLLPHEFRLARIAIQTARSICSMMSEDTLSIPTAQHCFNRFNSGNLQLSDSSHSRRPLQVNVDVLNQLIQEDPALTTCCLAERLRCSHITRQKHT